jgi:hypothetical protein
VIPDWVLERYRAGTLSAQRKEQLEQALREDPELAHRLEALATSDEEILKRYPPGWVRRQVEVKLGRQPQGSQGSRIVPLGIVLLTTAAAGALVVSLPSDPQLDRTKGGVNPQIEIFREGQDQPLPEGETAHEGDVLQIAIIPGEDHHGAVISIDGRGGVTLHAARLPHKDGTIILDEALKLDDAPSFERFFLVTGDEPIPVGTLKDAAQKLASDPSRARTEPLPLPPSFHQTDRLLKKEDSP